jgi:DNA-directed RNA polymerase subunit H
MRAAVTARMYFIHARGCDGTFLAVNSVFNILTLFFFHLSPSLCVCVCVLIEDTSFTGVRRDVAAPCKTSALNTAIVTKPNVKPRRVETPTRNVVVSPNIATVSAGVFHPSDNSKEKETLVSSPTRTVTAAREPERPLSSLGLRVGIRQDRSIKPLPSPLLLPSVSAPASKRAAIKPADKTAGVDIGRKKTKLGRAATVRAISKKGVGKIPIVKVVKHDSEEEQEEETINENDVGHKSRDEGEEEDEDGVNDIDGNGDTGVDDDDDDDDDVDTDIKVRVRLGKRDSPPNSSRKSGATPKKLKLKKLTQTAVAAAAATKEVADAVSEAIDNMMAAAVEYALANYIPSADSTVDPDVTEYRGDDDSEGGEGRGRGRGGESRIERETRQKYERIAEIVAAQNAPNYGKNGKLLLSKTQKLRNKLHRNYVFMQEQARRLQQLQPGPLPAAVVSNTKQMLADRNYTLYMPGDKHYMRPCTLEELNSQLDVAADVGSHSVYNKTSRQWKVALFCVRIVARATYPRAIGYYAQTDSRLPTLRSHGGGGGGGGDDAESDVTNGRKETSVSRGTKRSRSFQTTSSFAAASTSTPTTGDGTQEILYVKDYENANRKRRRQTLEQSFYPNDDHETKAAANEDAVNRYVGASSFGNDTDVSTGGVSRDQARDIRNGEEKTVRFPGHVSGCTGHVSGSVNLCDADNTEVGDNSDKRDVCVEAEDKKEQIVAGGDASDPLKLICILHDRDSGALGVGHIRMYFAWLSTQRISRVIFLMERGLTSQAVVEAQRLVDTMPWSVECEFFLFTDLSFLAKDHELVPLHETVPGDEVEALLANLRVDPARLPKIRLAQDPIAKYYGNRARDILRITSLSAMAGSVVSYCRVV